MQNEQVQSTIESLDFEDFEDFGESKVDGNEEYKSPNMQPFSEDIQKQLEAKFDELFGPIDG